ncbi:hypothetical protein F5I97DRAFT_107463 [Phlebopus sp. FC_14]|nr:hypothetical protein F5I97DRAFT_107463 [Phlebopus sp. FC_14]
MSSSSSTPPPSTAGPPFDSVDADVILRSSDNVDFRVFKVILSLASPVFKSSFSLPQHNNQTASPPIIELPEDSTTLQATLLLCYPGSNPTFASFSSAWNFAAALLKYDMEIVIQQAKVILLSQFVESHTVSLYALACHYGWRDVAERSAAEALKIKDLGRTTTYVDEMESMTAAAFQRLVSYHIACGEAARKVATGSYYSTAKSEYVSPSWHRNVYVFPETYRTESGQELWSRPSPSTLYDPPSLSFANAIGSGRFDDKHVAERFVRSRDLLAKEVQEAISYVKLEFKS